MSGPARLRALRLVGFKSFAERTTIEFGPGISAIVGPNGSGKSNLADALRWTLGEAGRLLRTRRSEDVIFAGSSARRAIGMADVTLLLDNSDRLLPVDYAEVEIGRRLYRSGESEYLLNRQRVRLRDLVELLDAGNLADNAFLFIGQGMVDQALALRPEERRPLFEEAAGVRRHERRRRQAEAELAEAELNLERLRDVLAELRPQARRLAAQAEQLEARQSAGLELAQALVASARARWGEAAPVLEREQKTIDEARAAADAAMGDLRAAETMAEQLSRAMGDRAELERGLRRALDELRSRTLELRLAQARRSSDIEALLRERERVVAERAVIEKRIAEARRTLAGPVPELEATHTLELEEVERELADMARDLERWAADHRAGSSRRENELVVSRLRGQAHAAERRLSEAEPRAAAAAEAAASAGRAREAAAAELAAAISAAESAEQDEALARAGLERKISRAGIAEQERSSREARLSTLRARLDAMEQALAASVDSTLARRARARGGGLVAEGLEVEPRFRVAVAAALGDAARGVALSDDAVGDLREGRGVVLLPAAAGTGRMERTPTGEALVSAAVAAGGGRLADGLRRDPSGHIGRLLARTVWLPELEEALRLRPELPSGWRIATLAGEIVGDDGLLRLAAADPYIQLRAERDELAPLERDLTAEMGEAAKEAEAAQAARGEAEAALGRARSTLDDARRRRRIAEEAERAAQRRAETAEREMAWEQERRVRLERELEGVRARLGETEAELGEDGAAGIGQGEERAGDTDVEARLAALRARRERLVHAQADEQARLQAAEDAYRRAEVGLAIDEARAVDLDAEAQRIAGREAELATERDGLTAEVSAAEEAERRAADELERVAGEGAEERSRLLQAERAAGDARERLRAAEARSRTAEVAAMEARLHLEAMREQLLVELAGIGPDALEALREGRGPVGVMAQPAPSPETLGPNLESALDAAVEEWRGAGEVAMEAPAPPSPARVAALRRRFHELGAGNPFAAEEYAEVRDRLAELEAQREDVEGAIRATRELIDGLTTLIAEQFRQTFAALEGAFGRRFEQLFGGGEAQLTLTVPDDLSATGIEITARPPGKKRQPLAMLSGGERALTAVALLLAMLEVRPVPFCVLDEVDAALDEANIARFQAALRSLADQTQFIVITHNRGTIEAADALYGVTIGEDAVSRIVSLRLPPAQADGEGEAEQPAVA